MAEINPVGCVKEIISCIFTECIQPSVKRHFDYWWCFDDNINELRDGVQDLESKTFIIKKKIEEAGRRTDVLKAWVEEWLKDASQKLAEARTILQDDYSPMAWWNITSQYSMGKMAKEKAEEIAKLLRNRDFDNISDPAPPLSERFKCHSSTLDFESRKHIEEEIIEYLRSSSVSMIGVCGMGGVGKTTMAKRIGDRVKKLFDEVVMVTVSKQNDRQIQEDIAESLKLEFDESDSRMPARANKLRMRLMDSKKKLIIFDDVWESLRFEDLGIPLESDSERCKVLLTSRCTDACKRIKNKKIFELKILDEKEAWILFKENAGECVEDSTLRSVAKHVAAECKGLPIALVTVGIALQNEMNVKRWKHSLSQLRQSNPTDLEEVLADVYKPLKLSYEYLANDNQKQLFLLCCLFPEDYDIPVELLTFYSMGLRLFDDISSIEEARNKTHALVEKLKSRFLLIDSKKKLHVNVHDVVRDVAIYIGSTERNGFLKSLNKTSIESSSDAECHWMSVDISNERMEIPEASRFPNLRLLMLLKLSSDEFSNISFQGMENLNVLSFPRTWVGSLPPTLGLLQKLQTLCLLGCEVENISAIGELMSLEIFTCSECEKITELPAEIGRLNRLRLLELNGCSNLGRIPFGILSSLVRLEELKMLESFDGWEAEENGSKEMKNASLTELESLPNLTCLEIKIPDSYLAAQQIRFPLKLVKYRISIGSEYYRHTDYEKAMQLNLPSDIAVVGNWIQMLVSKSEYLHLQGDGSHNINLEECKDLRDLKFSECSRVKKLVNVLPFLERLNLHQLENLEEICDGVIILNQNVSVFCDLKSVKIYGCHHLRSLFSVSVARICLLQLKALEIENCVAMEQVFMNESTEDDTDGCIEFPKLEELKLSTLPNLTAFCQGLQNFPNLAHVEISSCSNLKSLFSVSMARRCLLQLEVLKIQWCVAMEQVFRNENRDDTIGCIEFPKLKKLKLKKLPNLTAFYEGVETIQFPQLTEMAIMDNLRKMNSLCPLNSETPNHDTNSFHFLCNPKVEIGGLKDLTVDRLEDNSIWCHQIPINFFKNLETLKIHQINGIRNFMPYSVAKNLVSLKLLRISCCKDMVEVIESDDKEVVDFKSMFSTLKKLKFEGLPKLKRFWQWNHALELPLLEEVDIYDCHVMETFTSGSLNTPNLREITLRRGRRSIFYQPDLNQVIRQRWTLNQDKNKDVDEKDDEDENEDLFETWMRTQRGRDLDDGCHTSCQDSLGRHRSKWLRTAITPAITTALIMPAIRTALMTATTPATTTAIKTALMTATTPAMRTALRPAIMTAIRQDDDDDEHKFGVFS